MKDEFLTYAFFLTGVLNINESSALEEVTDHFKDGSPQKYTVKQKKGMFQFSKNATSSLVRIFKLWNDMSSDQKESEILEYSMYFNKSFEEYLGKNPGLEKSVGGTLLAEAVNNARFLAISEEKLDENIIGQHSIDIKTALVISLHKLTGVVFVPFTSKSMYWGEHGAHYYSIAMPRSIESQLEKLPEESLKRWLVSENGANWLKTETGRKWINDSQRGG